MPIVTYQDVKAHLNLGDDSDALELQGFIDAAIGIVEQRIGVVTPTAYTETFEATCWAAVPLRHTPVLSVQSVTEYVLNIPYPLTVEPAGTILDSYGYRLDFPDSGLLTRYTNGFPGLFRGPVTVSYTAGRTSVPAAVKMATLIIVAHLWQTQRGASPLPSLGGDVAPPVGQVAGVPPLALDLLRGYDTRTPTIA